MPAVTTTASFGVRISSPLEADEAEDTSLKFELLRSDNRGVNGDNDKSDPDPAQRQRRNALCQGMIFG